MTCAIWLDENDAATPMDLCSWGGFQASTWGSNGDQTRIRVVGASLSPSDVPLRLEAEEDGSGAVLRWASGHTTQLGNLSPGFFSLALRCRIIVVQYRSSFAAEAMEKICEFGLSEL